jgi:hypothetical protein
MQNPDSRVLGFLIDVWPISIKQNFNLILSYNLKVRKKFRMLMIILITPLKVNVTKSLKSILIFTFLFYFKYLYTIDYLCEVYVNYRKFT